jgi:hypothetical protein
MGNAPRACIKRSQFPRKEKKEKRAFHTDMYLPESALVWPYITMRELGKHIFGAPPTGICLLRHRPPRELEQWLNLTSAIVRHALLGKTRSAAGEDNGSARTVCALQLQFQPLAPLAFTDAVKHLRSR